MAADAQGVKRLVVIKIDGLPGYYVDKFVKERDPATGKSILPWIEEVFYKNGSRVSNFYTRGMSLSGPSWGQIDTGQHLQIKGNVEYDRFTLHAYDYLNFVPFYVGYGLGKKADMPAMEVLDQLRIPILLDAFPYERRYGAQQLYQRGNSWDVLGSGFVNMFPKDPSDLIDEWTIGFSLRSMTIDQVERDILGKLVKRDFYDYFDYYNGSFDHVSHHNSDTASRVIELKKLDRLIGRMWTAMNQSPRASETALVLESDHGFNSEDKTYSQGFNIVKLLASAPGGGHHVITKRRLMLDYSIKGLYPFIPLIRTSSKESYYLNGQVDEYPTALVDFDGNERSSIHLRNSDLNVMHIILQKLKEGKLSPEQSRAAVDAFFDVLERNRSEWRSTAKQLSEELDALHRWTDTQQAALAAMPKILDKKVQKGEYEAQVRVRAQIDIAIDAEKDYRKYVATLINLLSLSRENFKPANLEIPDLIAPGAMGDNNTVHQLQNYVIGPSPYGFVVNDEKELDLEKSFIRINYLELLQSQRVRNNVQPNVGSQPIDFVAVHIPAAAFPSNSGLGELMNDPIWLYAGPDKQILIISREDEAGESSYRYVPIRRLSQAADGTVSFEQTKFTAGLPLRYFEDKELSIGSLDRTEWLSSWHTESEWMNAVHKCKYSNGIIGLDEQMDRHPLPTGDPSTMTDDEKLLYRFRQHQRRLAEADMLILADDHWNFDVRGFNPGGNHGSFLRQSTNSTFMIAGGSATGIPKGLNVERPYDNLSVMPTLLRLMGKVDDENRPNDDLVKLGFRRFPGRPIRELLRK